MSVLSYYFVFFQSNFTDDISVQRQSSWISLNRLLPLYSLEKFNCVRNLRGHKIVVSGFKYTFIWVYQNLGWRNRISESVTRKKEKNREKKPNLSWYKFYFLLTKKTSFSRDCFSRLLFTFIFYRSFKFIDLLNFVSLFDS